MIEKLSKFSLAMLFALGFCSVGLVGCEEDSSLENAAEEVDDAGDEAADNLGDAADDTGDAIDDAVND